MVVYEQVEEYMKQVGLKYIKTPNDFISGLAYRTNKNYALEVANILNYRAEGAPTDNDKFYELKNDTLESSIYISAAFDGGVFRHKAIWLSTKRICSVQRFLTLPATAALSAALWLSAIPTPIFIALIRMKRR